jgi:hypothetical protein
VSGVAIEAVCGIVIASVSGVVIESVSILICSKSWAVVDNRVILIHRIDLGS